MKGRWFAGMLTASAGLRARAHLLVRLAERFDLEPGGLVITAALDQPVPALLTLARACDRVQSVLIGPIGAPSRRKKAP